MRRIARNIAQLIPYLRLPPRLLLRRFEVALNFAVGRIYEAEWERHARSLPDEDASGGGSFEQTGRAELALLLMAGLRPHHRVVDLGCGAGRLAAYLVPFLSQEGHYVGIDVSPHMLAQARRRVGTLVPAPRCRVSWVAQAGQIQLPDSSADVICAFSVFTHLEHEDSFRYLQEAARVIRPGGRFVYSCLTMDRPYAQEIFLASARRDFPTRWSYTRDVTTSRELMDEIAKLAGWRPVGWYGGDEPVIQLPGDVELHAFGQSVCILEAARG